MAFNDSTLEIEATYSTSICRSDFLLAYHFTEIGTKTLGREGSFSSKKSQRSINNDFAIGIENFKL